MPLDAIVDEHLTADLVDDTRFAIAQYGPHLVLSVANGCCVPSDLADGRQPRGDLVR
jgi:hypothetical protein